MGIPKRKRTTTYEKHLIDEYLLSAEELEALHKGSLTLKDLRILPEENLKPNQYFVAVTGDQKVRVPARVLTDGNGIKPVSRKLEAMGIKARRGNEEQLCALDALLDDDIKVVVLTGRAGSGKTLLALASAIYKMGDAKYEQIIVTKPMVQVGDNEFGILPGQVNEKFSPYLGNYMTNLEQIVTEPVKDLKDLNIDIQPLQLIRGVSWAGKFILADELQTLTPHEMLTLGTRVGEDSKLVIMGDLKQRDTAILETETGLYKLMHNSHFVNSPLTAAVELINVERSKVTELFTEVFE